MQAAVQIYIHYCGKGREEVYKETPKFDLLPLPFQSKFCSYASVIEIYYWADKQLLKLVKTPLAKADKAKTVVTTEKVSYINKMKKLGINKFQFLKIEEDKQLNFLLRSKKK